MAAFLEIPEIDWENIKDAKWFKNAISYLVYFLFIAYFVFIFIISSRDESALDNNKNVMYLLGIVIPLVAFIYIIFTHIGDTQHMFLFACMAFVLSIFLLRSAIPSFDKFLNDIILFFTNYRTIPRLSDETSFLITVSLKFLLFMIVVVFLSIVFYVFFDESFKQKGKMSVYFYAIFFIPCLVSDYFTYLFNEVRTTPVVVFSLILLEILLVLLYVYIPKLLSKVVLTNSKQLLSEPMELYTKKRIGHVDDFYNTTKDLRDIRKTFKSDEPTFLKNYSLSMWITINPPTFSEVTECMILRLGSDDSDFVCDASKNCMNVSHYELDNPRVGAPYVGCKGSKLKVVFSNNVYHPKEKGSTKERIDADKLAAATIEIDVPFQTWNFLVFNYHDNEVDLFINGKLVETKTLANILIVETNTLANILPIYKNTQVFCVGSNTNLLHGAVCDVRVQPDMLSQTQISQTYNLLKLKNPPVNNII
jgi:hypothetical protein